MKYPISLLLYSSVLVIGLCSCERESNLPQTPRDTVSTWIKWYDNNIYDSLQLITASNALQTLNDIQSLIAEDDIPTQTIISSLECQQDGNFARCLFCCTEGEEEYYYLHHNGKHWLIDSFAFVNDLPEQIDYQIDSIINTIDY